VGIPVFLAVLTVERQIGLGFGFFTTAWAFVATIAITRLVTSKISHERPLGAVRTMWGRELLTPRERTNPTGARPVRPESASAIDAPSPDTVRPRTAQQHIAAARRHVPGGKSLFGGGKARSASQAGGRGTSTGRGGGLPGESAIPNYTPSSAARSIDGHLVRTGGDVYAWYRLAPQRWSFRSDSQRRDLIAAIAGQYAELQGRWMHLRVTNRPYPIRMWAEAHVHNAKGRPD